MIDGKYKAPALSMGVKLVSSLSEARSPQGLSELARAIGTNKNMATRLLAILQEEGWVETVEPGPRYRLTLKPFSITSRSLGSLPLAELAREPLRALWEDCCESVYLGVPHNGKVLYLAHFDATGPVKIAGQVGGEYPLHCSAPGKALLAHMGSSVFKHVVADGLVRMTPNTLVDEKSLAAALVRIRDSGYATDNEEFGRGIICIAAPVFDHGGQVVGTIGLSATTISFTMESLVEAYAPKVVACAKDISLKLGFER